MTNMKKCFLLLLSLCCIISSCGNLSEKEIEETISTGVVLVKGHRGKVSVPNSIVSCQVKAASNRAQEFIMS